VGDVSEKRVAYQAFFQALIDELRDKHRFTNARVGQPQNWYSFTSGVSGFSYGFSFADGHELRAEVYIDAGDKETNKAIFSKLEADKADIERDFSESRYGGSRWRHGVPVESRPTRLARSETRRTSRRVTAAGG